MGGRGRGWGADLDCGFFFYLQGAVSGCRGRWALLSPKSLSSQVGSQNDNVPIPQGEGGREGGAGFTHRALRVLPGRRVGGQTALEMGLVNRAVDQNQAGDAAYREALSLAREILPQVRSSSSPLLLLPLQASHLLPHLYFYFYFYFFYSSLDACSV